MTDDILNALRARTGAGSPSPTTMSASAPQAAPEETPPEQPAEEPAERARERKRFATKAALVGFVIMFLITLIFTWTLWFSLIVGGFCALVIFWLTNTVLPSAVLGKLRATKHAATNEWRGDETPPEETSDSEGEHESESSDSSKQKRRTLLVLAGIIAALVVVGILAAKAAFGPSQDPALPDGDSIFLPGPSDSPSATQTPASLPSSTAGTSTSSCPNQQRIAQFLRGDRLYEGRQFVQEGDPLDWSRYDTSTVNLDRGFSGVLLDNGDKLQALITSPVGRAYQGSQHLTPGLEPNGYSQVQFLTEVPYDGVWIRKGGRAHWSQKRRFTSPGEVWWIYVDPVTCSVDYRNTVHADGSIGLGVLNPQS